MFMKLRTITQYKGNKKILKNV